jgi:hypothetical protein
VTPKPKGGQGISERLLPAPIDTNPACYRPLPPFIAALDDAVNMLINLSTRTSSLSVPA